MIRMRTMTVCYVTAPMWVQYVLVTRVDSVAFRFRRRAQLRGAEDVRRLREARVSVDMLLLLP